MALGKEKGTPLVFLHGFLGSARDWDLVARELPYLSIAFDLPGHGASPFDPDFCKALLASTEDLPSFHLIGYSMGGRLALQFTKKHPDKIASLTLLSAHLGLKTEEERKTRLEKDQKLAKRILEIPFDDFLKEWYDQPLFRTLVAKVDIRSMRKSQNREGVANALAAFSLGNQPEITPAAHLLVGEHDDAYRSHYKSYPHAVIPNAGHAVHLENPQAVARKIYDNLSM